MAKPALLTDLAVAIEGLMLIRPYSTSPEARVFGGALERLKDVEAVLLTMYAFKPAGFMALEAAAIEEAQIEWDDPSPEVTALIERYAKKREALR